MLRSSTYLNFRAMTTVHITHVSPPSQVAKGSHCHRLRSPYLHELDVGRLDAAQAAQLRNPQPVQSELQAPDSYLCISAAVVVAVAAAAAAAAKIVTRAPGRETRTNKRDEQKKRANDTRPTEPKSKRKKRK